MRPLPVPFAFAMVLAMGHLGCSSDAPEGPAATSGEALVEGDDGVEEGPDPAADAELGPDPEPMAKDEEIDVAAERADDVQDAEAAMELDQELALAPPPIAEAAKAPRCHKRIHVTFAVYTYLTASFANNGCWVPENTVADPSFRDCHSNGSVTHAHGDKWFYDDTNPRNPLGNERAALARCAAGATRGYEYMAFRDGRWRLVTEQHASAYFAELYTDDTRIDDLYYARGVYRGNATLRRHARVAPMLNFAPYPDSYSQREIGREILKVCKTVRNHGFLGLYEWHYPLPADSPRVRTLVQALNACTKKR